MTVPLAIAAGLAASVVWIRVARASFASAFIVQLAVLAVFVATTSSPSGFSSRAAAGALVGVSVASLVSESRKLRARQRQRDMESGDPSPR